MGNSRALVATVIVGNVDCRRLQKNRFPDRKNLSMSFEKMRDNYKFQGFIVVGWATNLL